MKREIAKGEAVSAATQEASKFILVPLNGTHQLHYRLINIKSKRITAVHVSHMITL